MLVRSAQAYNYSRKAGRAPAKGTIIKTTSTTIAFFSLLLLSFPSLFFLLSYFFVTVILGLVGLIIKKPDFDAFSLT